MKKNGFSVYFVVSLLLVPFIGNTFVHAAPKKSRPKTTLKQSPEQQAAALNNRAVDLLIDRKLPASEKLLREALRIAPQYPDTYCNLGSVLWEQDKGTEAERILRAGLKLKAENFIVALMHYNLGKVLAGTKRLESAATEYRAALKLNSEDEDSRTGLFEVLTERGIALGKAMRWKDAEPVWREALQLAPQNIEVQFQLANSLLFQKKYDQAETLLQKVVAAMPEREIYTMSLIGALVAQDKEAQAEPLARKLIDRKWKEPLMRRTLGQILIVQTKYEDAEREVRQSIKIAPREGENYVLLADCLLKLKRFDEARNAVKTARELGMKNDKRLDEIEQQLSAPPPAEPTPDKATSSAPPPPSASPF